MKTLTFLSSLLIVLIFAGCDGDIYRRDLTPPAAPRGLYTETGDNIVELFWYENTEHDVQGYNVYSSVSLAGPYTYIGSSADAYFVDRDARNGTTYYYAVSAYDYHNNESELSKDIAYDTPRPEGYGVVLRDFRTSPGAAGYDFSTYSVGMYDDKYTDVFFEHYNGQVYLNVWTDTDIQDMGYTSSILDIREAPERGWSTTGDVPVVAGHTYVVWTWDDHYAKIRVISVTSTRVEFDWTYQLQPANPRLKRSAGGDRTAILSGRGLGARK